MPGRGRRDAVRRARAVFGRAQAAAPPLANGAAASLRAPPAPRPARAPAPGRAGAPAAGALAHVAALTEPTAAVGIAVNQINLGRVDDALAILDRVLAAPPAGGAAGPAYLARGTARAMQQQLEGARARGAAPAAWARGARTRVSPGAAAYVMRGARGAALGAQRRRPARRLSRACAAGSWAVGSRRLRMRLRPQGESSARCAGRAQHLTHAARQRECPRRCMPGPRVR